MAGGLVMMAVRKMIVPKVMPQQMQPDAFSEEQEMKVAAGTRLGHSALMGSVYGLTRSKLRFMPPPLMGAAFALGVWALSFEGWIPALGIKEKTSSKLPQKWFVPIMGHMVYGAVTALAFKRLSSSQRQKPTREPYTSRENLFLLAMREQQ